MNKETFRIDVDGRPRPWSGGVGGLRIFPSTATEQWQKTVRDAAEARMAQAEHPGFGTDPVTVLLYFYYERPKKTIYPDAPRVADLDKLTRVVLDALTQAGVMDDDKHVIYMAARKRWDESSGLMVNVRPWGLAGD